MHPASSRPMNPLTHPFSSILIIYHPSSITHHASSLYPSSIIIIHQRQQPGLWRMRDWSRHRRHAHLWCLADAGHTRTCQCWVVLLKLNWSNSCRHFHRGTLRMCTESARFDSYDKAGTYRISPVIGGHSPGFFRAFLWTNPVTGMYRTRSCSLQCPIQRDTHIICTANVMSDICMSVLSWVYHLHARNTHIEVYIYIYSLKKQHKWKNIV